MRPLHAFCTLSGICLAGGALAQTAPAETPSTPTKPNPATAALATKPTRQKPHVSVSPALSFYMPSDSFTRNRMGSYWPGIGVRVGPGMDEHHSGFGLQFDLFKNPSNDADVSLAPLSIGYACRLHPERHEASSYVGASIDIVGVKLRSDMDGVNTGWWIGPGASVFVGRPLNARTQIQAEYHFIKQDMGFDLSGAKVGISYRL